MAGDAEQPKDVIEFNGSYLMGYVAKDEPPADPSAYLSLHVRDSRVFLEGIAESASTRRYSPGKWSVKGVVGHVCDAHLIFLYRMVAIARGEAAPLPGFDENAYAASGGFDEVAWAGILDRYRGVSAASLAFLGGISHEAWHRLGVANGIRLKPVHILQALRAHERHHFRILRERYGIA